MKKENQQIRKIELRKSFLVLRSAISQHRQEEASYTIVERLRNRGRILTFYSIGSEINLSRLNSFLANAGRLMSNRLEQGLLVPYHLHFEKDLLISHFGILEPDPLKNRKALPLDIDLILVPGLAFDHKGHRLGYGKGYYDKFLATMREIPTAGIGFREQMSADLLPRQPWDIPVKELILV